jgi:hypothetical protein
MGAKRKPWRDKLWRYFFEEEPNVAFLKEQEVSALLSACDELGIEPGELVQQVRELREAVTEHIIEVDKLIKPPLSPGWGSQLAHLMGRLQRRMDEARVLLKKHDD